MSTNRKLLLNSTVIAGLAAASLGAPSLALAQDQAADLPTTTSAADTDIEELIVTGSRIRRNEFSSPDPVQVISAETGRLKGVADAGALLRSASVVSGSSQITTTISSAFVTDGGPGAQPGRRGGRLRAQPDRQRMASPRRQPGPHRSGPEHPQDHAARQAAPLRLDEVGRGRRAAAVIQT